MTARTRWLLAWVVALSFATGEAAGEAWKRHTIDDSSRGADGVRLADVNRDGLPDIVTPWEQGGAIRVYLNPGHDKSRKKWPMIEVGNVGSPEDAVFVDLDGDGATDVVSSCEGGEKTVFAHWAPTEKGAYMDGREWHTEAFASTKKKQAWMFCLPMQIDGKRGVDLVVGSKGANAGIGWLQSPENARNMEQWKYHRLDDAGWIMSLIAYDFDADGDEDILLSDRKGKNAGVRILENPGAAEAAKGLHWRSQNVGGNGKEVMFLALGDLDGDGTSDILASTRNDHFELFFEEKGRRGWTSSELAIPFAMPHGKSVAIGDLNLDGRVDLVSTNRRAPEDRSVIWMESKTPRSGDLDDWKVHDIGGTEGSKFDLIELLDLDGDGDLDVLTCEEVANLGVFWYENPIQ